MPAPFGQLHGEALLRPSSLPHLCSPFFSFIKCCCGSGHPGLLGSFLSGRRGDERVWECHLGWTWSDARRGSSDTATWSTSSVGLRRPLVVLRSTHIVEGRLLRALSSACRRHLFFNLLAGVPHGRPSLCSSTAFPCCTVPNVLVPGDGADGREWRHRGGEGHEAFSKFTLWSLL
jgi:hypothetical protein